MVMDYWETQGILKRSKRCTEFNKTHTHTHTNSPMRRSVFVIFGRSDRSNDRSENSRTDTAKVRIPKRTWPPTFRVHLNVDK